MSGGKAATGLSSAEVLERFRRRGALLEGHFLLSSGLHSPVYFQSALLLQFPPEAESLAWELGRRVGGVLCEQRGEVRPAVVVAPALGGVVIGYELARVLGTRGIFTERAGGRMTLRRGFAVQPGELAVVCEDVVTTGGSAREVAELVRARGGSVAAVAALVHRGQGEPDLGAPLVALARLTAPVYPPDACPQCAQGLPAVKPGSRGTNGVRTK